MNLKAIYHHMEKGAQAVPEKANCKIVFRHSIRKSIVSGVGREVPLTNEGITLAQWFGQNLKYDIGFFASSSCERNIHTCKEILAGKGVHKDIVIASEELECPPAKDKELSGKIFEQYNFKSDIIIHKVKTEGLPGFNTIKKASQIMLDFIFSNGNEENTIDLFCTHDFQMAILYAYLFDYDPMDETLKHQQWPMMLEGMIFWGDRKHFWCSWRDEIKEFINF